MPGRVLGLLGPDPRAQPGPTAPLEELLRDAGLEPDSSADVDVPWEIPDRPTLQRALLAPGGAASTIEHAGEDAARAALVQAAAPFRRRDGSYRLQNRFTYVIGRRR